MRGKPKDQIDIIPLSRLALISRDKVTRQAVAVAKKRHRRKVAKRKAILASELSNYEKRRLEPWQIVSKT